MFISLVGYTDYLTFAKWFREGRTADVRILPTGRQIDKPSENE